MARVGRSRVNEHANKLVQVLVIANSVVVKLLLLLQLVTVLVIANQIFKSRITLNVLTGRVVYYWSFLADGLMVAITADNLTFLHI